MTDAEFNKLMRREHFIDIMLLVILFIVLWGLL